MVEVLDNTQDRKVIDAIKSHIKDSKEACFAVGYFFLNGWDLIKDDLPEKAKPGFLKILIGRELDFPTYEEISKGYKLRLKTKMLEDLSEVKDIGKIRELYKLIKEGIVDFKIFLDGKLHSKLYLFINHPEYLDDTISYSPGSAIVGSSNFTVPGTLENKELNVLITDRNGVKFLYNWFNQLWESSEEFRDELIKIIDASGILKVEKIEELIPIGKYVHPKTLFKYLAWIWLNGNIEPIEKKDVLAEFQVIGVVNAVNMISEHNGVIIADSVGLGKSFIGAAVIEEYLRGKYPAWDPNRNGYNKPRKALLILPPSLIPQWEYLLFKSGYFFSGDLAAIKTSSDDRFITYDVLRNEQGYRKIGEVSLLSLGIFSRMSEDDVYAQRLNEEYDLILIDEAHKFRNRWTNRWRNARALRFKRKDDPNSFRNKFIMLTATPVNNTIWDIYNLIRIFSDNNFESFKNKGVHITELFNQYKEIKKKWRENPKEEDKLILKAQEIKNKVLNEIMILRTRKYLMERFGKDGKIRIAGKELTFKDPVPDKVDYSGLNGKYNSYWDFLKKVEEEFEDLEFSFTKLYTSGYVVLSSSEFREGAKDEEEEKILVPINVILKFLLAKRLESSIFAFERTMSKLKAKNDRFYEAIREVADKTDLQDEDFLKELKRLAKTCISIAEKEDILKEFEEETEEEIQKADPRVRMYMNLLEYGGADLALVEENVRKEEDLFRFLEESPSKGYLVAALKAGLRNFYHEIARDKRILDSLKKRLDEIKEKDEFGRIKVVDTFTEENEIVEIPKYMDPKLEKLKQLVYTDLAGKKFIVFTQYRDTALYVYRTLTKWIRDQKRTLPYLFNGEKLKVGLVTGDLDMEEKEKMIKRFAPHANDALEYAGEKEIMILISTDSLSEGVNLQDADGVVNYDLPWNPMIIVQRVGRVNRIGNEKDVFVKNFVPAKELETIIGILAKISEKIRDITFLVGKEYYILSGEEEIKIETFGEKIKDIAEAKMSQLEEMSLADDARHFGDITRDEDIAKFELLDFIHNTLKLRKEEFDDIKELVEKRTPLYTLTNSKELIRVYELYRGKTKIGGIVLKSDGNTVEETTCREFMRLWNTEEAEDADFSEIRRIIDRMDEYFQKEILEKRKGMRTPKGFIRKIFTKLRDFTMTGKLEETKVDEEKLKALIGNLPYLEMTSQEIGKFKRFLRENGCIDDKEDIKDYAKFVNKAYEYLKVSNVADRELRYNVLGWWV